MTEHRYVAAVLAAYIALPDTACRPRHADRALAHRLFAEGVPPAVVLTAMLLAHVRRHLDPASPPEPVRSLHYFVPVIRELTNLDPDVLALMQLSLHRHAPDTAKLLGSPSNPSIAP
jgi:hypothetical protein